MNILLPWIGLDWAVFYVPANPDPRDPGGAPLTNQCQWAQHGFNGLVGLVLGRTFTDSHCYSVHDKYRMSEEMTQLTQATITESIEWIISQQMYVMLVWRKKPLKLMYKIIALYKALLLPPVMLTLIKVCYSSPDGMHVGSVTNATQCVDKNNGHSCNVDHPSS